MAPDSSIEDSLFGVILQDSYRITGLLGEGGMGAVYDAMQIRLNKRVAIKVMSRELASNVEALNRFHREAMITSGLGHPHIVQVFDFSKTPTGQPFLAMEYLAGEDLNRRLSRVGSLSPLQTVHIVKQVASALAATHAQEIVHRDLKPANIYLLNVAGEDDFVKVLDFGISKIRAANTKITKASALIGTPDYMSPEQAMGMGDEVDHRTDQWALACIAWECLAGRAPFFGDSVPSVLFQVVHRDPPSLAALVPGLPRGVEPVLRKALSKEKDGRFPNVTEFAQALESAVTSALSASTAAVVEQPIEHVPSARVATEKAAAETVPYAALSPEERSERPTTTFSQAAQETLGGGEPRSFWPKWRWAIAGGGTVALALVALLVLRPAPGSKRPAASAAVPVAAPAPPPAALPPAAPPPPPPPAPVPVAEEAKAVPEAPAAEDKPPAPASEVKRRAKKPGAVRRTGKAGGPQGPVPVTGGRLIKEL